MMLEFLPVCYIIAANGQLTDLTYLCGNPPAIVEAIVPSEPDYIVRARETIADPNSDVQAINTARIILNAHESWKLSVQQAELYRERIGDGQ